MVHDIQSNFVVVAVAVDTEASIVADTVVVVVVVVVVDDIGCRCIC
jgi:hypothetical protein